MVGTARRARLCPPYGRCSSVQSRRLGALVQIAGAEIVRADVGQLAFEAFDVEPQRAAMAEHQHRAAAGRDLLRVQALHGWRADRGCCKILGIQFAVIASEAKQSISRHNG